MRRASRSLIHLSLIVLALTFAACSSQSSTTPTTSGTSTTTHGGSATATPTPAALQGCAQALPGGQPFNGVSGVSGLQLPSGSMISSPSSGGGGNGQYTVQSYTICFPGAEAAIDGGNLTPSGTPTSAIGNLVHAGWTLNNLFPDPTSFAYLDYCSAPHICLNTSGTPNPFTFVGFDQFNAQAGGVTTARLAVGSMAKPICLNDVGYYSGAPKYTLYFDGNTVAGGGTAAYHFQMPPETRVSTFNGGGTAGSTYNFFCSGGDTTSVVAFLTQAMQNIGWTVTPNSTGFSATDGSSPTYMINLNIRYPNNYSLQVFIPQ